MIFWPAGDRRFGGSGRPRGRPGDPGDQFYAHFAAISGRSTKSFIKNPDARVNSWSLILGHATSKPFRPNVRLVWPDPGVLQMASCPYSAPAPQTPREGVCRPPKPPGSLALPSSWPSFGSELSSNSHSNRGFSILLLVWTLPPARPGPNRVIPGRPGSCPGRPVLSTHVPNVPPETELKLVRGRRARGCRRHGRFGVGSVGGGPGGSGNHCRDHRTRHGRGRGRGHACRRAARCTVVFGDGRRACPNPFGLPKPDFTGACRCHLARN